MTCPAEKSKKFLWYEKLYLRFGSEARKIIFLAFEFLCWCSNVSTWFSEGFASDKNYTEDFINTTRLLSFSKVSSSVSGIFTLLF